MPYKDPEKKKEYMKQYNNSYRMENLHSFSVSQWKFQGIKLRPNEDWTSVYLFYITCEECEKCNIKLIEGCYSNSRTLDHDHETGFIRNVLCRACNIKRG